MAVATRSTSPRTARTGPRSATRTRTTSSGSCRRSSSARSASPRSSTGLVGAYETQSEEAFLTTQQVDEARHAQHFNHFYTQVVGYDGSFEDRLDRAREDLNDAFKVLFDDVLVDANRRLLADPADLEAKVDFVTTYHMVIEGTLALTGQDTLTDVFERDGILPGFLEGFRKISQDEHRHVAYGTWFLQQKAARTRRWRARIQDKLQSS